jgi:serine/threonine-protein kinase
MSDVYRLTGGVLGHGHFAEGVYTGEHKALQQARAVKLLRVDALTNRDELLAEAQKMAALEEDDHVVKVYDAGDWDSDRVYIASEICEKSLVDAAANKIVDPATACKWISEACRGLDHMHQNGLLHLDVRPANILIGKDGRIKVTDFGLARWIVTPDLPHVYSPHAAPELVDTGQGSESADQYATAMTLAHLLTAGLACDRPPAPGGHQAAAASRDWPHLDSLGPEVPERLRRVLRKATSFNAVERYLNIEEFKRAVDAATPKVAFAQASEHELISTDSEWSIRLMRSKGSWSVEVRQRGRRKGALCRQGMTEAVAWRYVRKLVSSFAYD